MVDNVIIFPKDKPVSKEGWGQREQEAIELARLAVMPLIEYEKVRRDVAKKMEWRPAFLDRLVMNIRRSVYSVGGKLLPVEAGTATHGDGKLGFLVSKSQLYIGSESTQYAFVVVLPDGNGTVMKWYHLVKK